MEVLLLDDEPIELAQLELLINTHYPTWNVHQALSGSEAIRKVDARVEQGETFHLAFVDVKLPGRSGLEVASLIKGKIPGIDIIIVTAFQDFEYAKESIKLRAFDYVVKPVIEKEFLDVLGKYVLEHPEFGMKNNVIEKVISKIKDRYMEPLRLTTLAADLHFNPNYLSRLFSEEMGMSFSEFLLQYRIEMAKQMLIKHREWSIHLVAERCGFSSQHHLSSSFKKYTKVSPSEYRSMVLNK